MLILLVVEVAINIDFRLSKLHEMLLLLLLNYYIKVTKLNY